MEEKQADELKALILSIHLIWNFYQLCFGGERMRILQLKTIAKIKTKMSEYYNLAE